MTTIPTSPPFSRNAVIRRRLFVLIPSCLFIGACAELFMIKTGFYSVAKRKEVERKVERLSEDARYWEERRIRDANRALEQLHRQQPVGATASSDLPVAVQPKP